MAVKDNVAMRKRAQIAQANRTMFVWVAIVSAVVSFAVVGSYFLGQKAIFNIKVLDEKYKTVATLKSNNKVVPGLEGDVRALNSNTDLMAARASTDDKAIQAILDALPSEPNSLALGASLQNRLLAGIPSLVLDSITIDPVQGVDTPNSGVEDASGGDNAGNSIGFSFAIIGSDKDLYEAMTRLERSIRLIEITSLTLESRLDRQVLTVHGRAFYEPAKIVELKDKVVKP